MCPTTDVQRSWLEVALNDLVFTRKWVILDNGVLWIHSESNGSSFAEDVIPLQDTEVCCPAYDAKDTIGQRATFAVKTRTKVASRMVYLRAPSENEYRRWIAAILEAARVWHARRETASLYGPEVKGDSRAPPQQCPLEDLNECSKRIVKSLNRFSDKCAELRLQTRKAVTHTGEDVLPRFHRRAVNDAVEKIWRASERARSVVAAGGDVDAGAYLIAIRGLREDVGAFVTYCNLLQDLQTMLGQVSGLDSLTVIRQLSVMRAALRLRRPRGHEAAHAAALAAVDAILQRCWMEIQDQRLPARVCSEGPASQPEDVLFLLQERELRGGATRARGRHRLAKLKRDVSVSVSQRRASKRARSEALQEGEAGVEMVSLAGPTAGVSTEQADGEQQQELENCNAQEQTGSQSSPLVSPSAVTAGKYATLRKTRQRPKATHHETGGNIPLRIRRKTYTPGSAYDFGDEEDLDEAFVETPIPKEKEPVRSSSPAQDLLDTPVTPATPNGGGRRALWCETMEVQQSGLLDRLSPSESALQEAKFEVLSSEESYLRSLDVLAQRVNAIEALHDPFALSDLERDAVHHFLDSARACSLRFVSALRRLWSQDVLLRGLCGLVHREATSSLLQYAVIVGMQPRAACALAKIGSAEASQLVPLLSLPAQRASRLPLLLAAILRRLDQRTSEAVICRAALDRLNQIVFECNESLRRAEHTERMCALSKKLLADTQAPRKKTSWRERKSSVLGRAKLFFQKSSSFTCRTRTRASTSSLAPLAPVER